MDFIFYELKKLKKIEYLTSLKQLQKTRIQFFANLTLNLIQRKNWSF